MLHWNCTWNLCPNWMPWHFWCFNGMHYARDILHGIHVYIFWDNFGFYSMRACFNNYVPWVYVDRQTIRSGNHGPKRARSDHHFVGCYDTQYTTLIRSLFASTDTRLYSSRSKFHRDRNSS
jgi:hypothetical protein